jgi:mRNA interferase HigB
LCQLRIISKSRVKEWCKSLSVIKAPLLHWLGVIQKLESTSFNDLRKVFNDVDQTPVASGKLVCVFNIGYGKNAYRLITSIHFDRQKLHTHMLLTHAEYDKGTWKNEL